MHATLSGPDDVCLYERSIQNPEGVHWLRGFYQSLLASEPGDVGCTLRLAALAGMVAIRRHEALMRVRNHLVQLRAELPRLTKDSSPAELRRLSALVDEAVDLTLDVWEPERTAFMEQLLPLQAMLRRLLAHPD